MYILFCCRHILIYTYLSTAKQNAFTALQTRDFIFIFFKGNFRHCGDYFLENGQKRKSPFWVFQITKISEIKKKNLQIFVLYSPRKQTILFSFFVHSSICFNCLMSGCHFSYVTDIEKKLNKKKLN
jgi:hypothetical protein